MIYLFKLVIFFCVTQEVDNSDYMVSKSKTYWIIKWKLRVIKW